MHAVLHDETQSRLTGTTNKLLTIYGLSPSPNAAGDCAATHRSKPNGNDGRSTGRLSADLPCPGPCPTLLPCPVLSCTRRSVSQSLPLGKSGQGTHTHTPQQESGSGISPVGPAAAWEL